MKIILLKDVRGTGRKNEIKTVPDGFARNFLFPNNLAKPATESTIQSIKQKNFLTQKQEEIFAETIKEITLKINTTKPLFQLKTGKKGEVFSSVNAEDIKKEVISLIPANIQPIIRERLKIGLGKPIREKGDYEILAQWGNGIETKLIISVN